MTSTRITPPRLALAAGVALFSTLAIAAPALAVDEFPPNAAVAATSGCEGGIFHLHTTMSNLGGLDTAHFVVTAVDVKGPITIGVGVDLAPNDSRVDDWQMFEGVTGSVHITSADNTPAVDFFFEITPDCVPEVTTTVATTIPATTIPATIPVTTVPATTVPTAIPATPTTVVAQFVPTALPATGSSNSTTGLLAFGLLGMGILMLRLTRRAN